MRLPRTGTVPIYLGAPNVDGFVPPLRKRKGELPDWAANLRILTKIGAPV
jgi:hypothetical protein